MDDTARQFLKVLEESLICDYEIGNCTPLGEDHTQHWRTMGCALFAQVVGGSGYDELEGRGIFQHQDQTALIIPGGVPHRAAKTTPGPAVSRWSHVNFRVFSSVDVFSLFVPPVIIGGPAGIEIGDINARLAVLRLADQPSLQVAIERRSLLFRLLHLAIERATPSPRCGSLLQAAERLAPVLAAIERELGRAEFGLAQLTNASGLSRSRFHTLFAGAFGMSPMRYLRQRRLERSRQLLVGSDLPVSTIAERVGFADQFHFSHAFKIAFGRSPSTYRTEIARDWL
ncbi:hypothetical protein LBMAG53_20770 [Planctomycetota bacterium]|nr:hypothetical protein LBMAG53_20770 [Planctomycetota bacterium]